MADIVKQILAKPILLADQVTKGADDVSNFKAECAKLKARTEKLATLLRQAARAGSDLYEQPLRRIIDETEQAFDKALTLVIKCRANGIMKRVLTIIPTAAFKKVIAQLENSIGDVTWVLAVSASPRVEEVGLPPIASNEPILCMIWEQIATLYTGSMEVKSDAAASLVSLADNARYSKLIIEEGGVVPLLRLVKEGRQEGQEDAARAIGLLARDPESVEQMLLAGVCSVFAKILKEGSMKVQSVVAWAISELASSHPNCQDHFAQNNIIRLLVSHLAFETVQEHSKYAVSSKAMPSIHSIVLANNNNAGNNKSDNAAKTTNDEEDKQLQSQIPHPTGANNAQNQMLTVVKSTMAANANGNNPNAQNPSKPPFPQKQTNSSSAANHHHHHHHGSKQNISLSGASIKGREYEDPASKAEMKAVAARALWKLCKGNSGICRSITESRALLCFAVLLEKGPEEVQYNSAMALMEIASVAEQDADLRRSAFNPNSPAAKAVVDQLLRIVEKADSDLLVPCIMAIGSLARTFRATETRIIGPLVRLLDEREGYVTREAVIALTKFASSDNYLHVDHSKAILNAGGAKHLVQLVYFGEQMVQKVSLVLLCYIAFHVPDSEALAQAEVLTVFEWASKQGYNMAQNPLVEPCCRRPKADWSCTNQEGLEDFTDPIQFLSSFSFLECI